MFNTPAGFANATRRKYYKGMGTRTQRGFGVVEVIVIIVLVLLIVGGGWYFMRQLNNSTSGPQAGNRTAEMKSYTDSAKLYSLQYPGTWSVKEAADCCEGAPKDYTKISRSVTLAPVDRAHIHGYGVDVQADKTDALAKSIVQNWADNKHKAETKTVNGYEAKYVKKTFSGDAENYIDHQYLLTHNGATVFATFREKYYHQYPAEDWSADHDLDDFNQIIQSVTFLQ